MKGGPKSSLRLFLHRALQFMVDDYISLIKSIYQLDLIWSFNQKKK